MIKSKAELDQFLEHIRMGLAEAGYPGTDVWFDNHLYGVCVATTVPAAVAWTAMYLAEGGGYFGKDRHIACWSCWSSGIPEVRRDCEESKCVNPGKSFRPPRELLGKRNPLYTYGLK